MAVPLIEAAGLQKSFGRTKALVDGTLRVEPGEVHVLIGSNGSGKSTLSKIVAGALRPDSGELRFDGKPVAFADPAEARRAGVGVFYQESGLVPALTVAENILLGIEQRGPLGRIDQDDLRQRAEAALRRFGGLAETIALDTPVRLLPPDARQVVEIAKLVARDPRLFIFDEATASLGSSEVASFFGLLRALKEQGKGIVFISHRMDEIFAIGDRATVLRDGATVAHLELSRSSPEELLSAMVGRRLAEHVPAVRDAAGPPLLTIEGLSAERLDGASLEVRAGEIVGLGGLQGQGQSALLRAVFGAVPRRAGTVRLDGAPVRAASPIAAIRQGIAYVSGDRRRSGILGPRSILENLAHGVLSKESRAFLARRAFVRRVSPVLERMRLRFPGYDAPITALSGGNQQKVVIGRWLATAPRLLLLDDPTKGIDVEAKTDLYRILGELAEAGVAILLYSSEDEELVSNSDRILVLNSGRIVRELRGADKTVRALTSAAFGEPRDVAA